MAKVMLFTVKGLPLVIQDAGGKYYVQNVEFIDDISILLNAISRSKSISYHKHNELRATAKTKEEYWQILFNYQYNDGGLIRWQNPTQVWNEELTRRGVLFCPKCNTKMVMYYRSWCPICEPPKPRTVVVYNYKEMVYYIEAKYNIKLTIDDQNFWHFICDEYWSEMTNDSYYDLCWPEVRKCCKHDWQREICDLFIKEYGSQQYLVLVSW